MPARPHFGLASVTSLRAIMLACPIVLAAPGLAQGKAEQRTALIKVGEPEGFAALTAEQAAVVDIFFGGRRVGAAQVRYRPDSLTFVDPSAVLASIPHVKNRDLVRSAFEAPLATNPDLVCAATVVVPSCGRLEPTVVGIIFDRDRFRLDLFINSSLLETKAAVERVHLQAPEADFSFVDSLDGVLSGSELGANFYNIQNRLIVAKGATRLRADLGAASGFGVQAERLAIEADRPGWRYMAGAFWTPGTDLIGRRKMLGIGVETQVDTRLDRDVVRGNPLVVVLGRRARVDILLEGRVLASGIYEAGNQALDTTGLPDGTYEVVVRVNEIGGERHEEKRLFTRNPRIPAAGQKVLFAYAGTLVDDRSRAFLDLTPHPLFQGGAAWRLDPHLAIDVSLTATDRAWVGELGGYLIARPAQLRLALIAGSRGDYGGLVQISSNGHSPFNFHFDLRRIVSGDDPSAFDDFANLALARRTFTQASGTLSYSIRQAQISLAATWRDEAGVGRSYAVGPRVRWGVMQQGSWRLFVNGDAALTEKGKSGYLGLNLQLSAGGVSLGARSGARSDARAGEANLTGFVGALDAAVQREFGGGILDVGAGIERDLERDVVNATARLKTQRASFDGDVLRTFGTEAGLQYSLGLHTTFAGTRGGADFQGRERSEGMLLVKIDGGQSQDRFEVLVNDARAALASGGEQVMIAKPAYREYDVRIRPISGGLVQYDGNSQRVALYPGSVARMSWKARTIVPVLGRIRLQDGTSASGAKITAGSGSVDVDDSGYFQIDAGLDEPIDVRLADGRTCQLGLSLGAKMGGYVTVGDVMCNPNVRLGSLESAK